jgi:hypothetical protein
MSSSLRPADTVHPGVYGRTHLNKANLYAAMLINNKIDVWLVKDRLLGYKKSWPETEQKVKRLVAMENKFIVLLDDGELKQLFCGRDKTLRDSVIRQKQDGPAVKQIYATKHAYAALLIDGSVIVGGNTSYGSRLDEKLVGVKEICTNDGAFAALLETGRVRVWGGPEQGGDNNALQGLLGGRPVSKIYSNSAAFAAVLADGKVVSWGGNELASLPQGSIPVLEKEIDLLAGRAIGQSRRQLDEGKQLDQITIIMPGSSVKDQVTLNRKVTYISKYLDEIVELNQKEVERTGEKKKGVTFVMPDFISKKTMQLIIRYMRICDGEEPPHIKMPLRFFKLEHLIGHEKKTTISAYIESMDMRDMTNVLVAASFLVIDSLINLIQARLAIMLLDKNDEEIESTLAPAVVQQIRGPSERTAQIKKKTNAKRSRLRRRPVHYPRDQIWERVCETRVW